MRGERDKYCDVTKGQSSSRRREYREPSGLSFLKVLSGGLPSGAERGSLCCSVAGGC